MDEKAPIFYCCIHQQFVKAKEEEGIRSLLCVCVSQLTSVAPHLLELSATDIYEELN
jgi:hypothetical protein